MNVADLFKKTAYYFLTAHFFIACVATALALGTNIILQQPFQSPALYMFIFCSTFFAYNVYYIKTGKAHFYRSLAIVSFAACLLLLFFIPPVHYIKIFFIGLASAMYIFPLFFSFKKNRSFTVQKLLLLVFIWTATTFILPASELHYNYPTLMYLIYRIVFMLSVCMLFFVRDEKNEVYKRKGIAANYVLAFLQILIAVIILATVHFITGCIFLSISLLSLLLVLKFLSARYPAVYYLAFADGILFLQGLIVIIFHCLKLL